MIWKSSNRGGIKSRGSDLLSARSACTAYLRISSFKNTEPALAGAVRHRREFQV